jgi:ABC-type polysaccharide/polyol phosphate export permease
LIFPVSNLSRALLAIAAAIPLTLGLDGVRQLLLPGGAKVGFISPQREALILLAMTAVFTIGATRLMRVLERKGKRDGTMTLRWQ